MRKNQLQILVIMFFFIFTVGCQTKSFEIIDPTTSVIFVLNKGEPSVSVIDTTTYQEIATWMLDFTFSGALLMPDNQTILFYGKNEENLYFIDSSTGKLQKTVSVPKGISNGVVLKEFNELIFTNVLNNTVLFYDLNGNLIEEVPVEDQPSTIIQTTDQKKLFIYNFSSASISAIDVEKKEVTHTFQANAALFGGIVNESNDELWVGGHGDHSTVEEFIYIYSTETGELVDKLKAPSMAVAFEKNDHGDIFVLSHGTNKLRRFNSDTKELTGSLTIGSNPLGIAINHSTLFISNYDKHKISIVNAEEMVLIKEVEVGKSPFQILLRKGEPQ